MKEKERKRKTINLRIDNRVYQKYKKFCKDNGLIIGKRIEDLMDADLEKRIIKLPEVRL